MFRARSWVAALAAAVLSPVLSHAADADPVSLDASAALPSIVVTAQRLNDARGSIKTQTGASIYTIDAAALAATPRGDNTLLQRQGYQLRAV